MTFNLQKWEKWARWIEPIRSDVQAAVADQATFTEFRENVLLDADWLTATRAAHFTNYVARTHVRRVALDVRRHVKVKRESFSLSALMVDMCDVADAVTFAFYLERHPRRDGRPPWQELVFRKVSIDGESFSPELIAGDVRELKALCEEIETFADRSVAHLDMRGCDAEFTWGRLDEAVDKIDKLACKYVNLLTGTYSDSLNPIPQYDWIGGLRKPLIRPKDAMVLPEGESHE